MSKETVKQYIRNQYTGKEQCQFLPQINQLDPLAQPSLDNAIDVKVEIQLVVFRNYSKLPVM